MKRTLAVTGATCALALAVTACGGGGSDSASSANQELKGQTVTVAGVWTGTEQANFKKVLAAFSAATGARTEFVSTGDNVSTVIDSKVQGGDAPDVVMVPQVGVLQQFAAKNYLVPLSATAQASVTSNYSAAWKNYGSVGGKLYGLYYKASDKSTVWYSPTALDTAGVTAPKTFKDLLGAAKTVSDSGTPAFAVAGQDGWPLTDWFENVYLSQAGPDNYDKLAQHKIPWTDPTVVKALTTLGTVFGDDTLLAGGRKGALQTDLATSVQKVFGDKPAAGMTYEGDFVSGIVSGDLHKTVGTDAKFFPFPSVDGGPAPVVSGGDAAVVLKAGKNQKAGMKLVEYLASPEAATIWAKLGGFLSPNKGVAATSYPDDTTRAMGKSLVDAGDAVRFDMSDQAPAAFGGTQGTGEWKILQDFLRDPSNPKATAATLESAAAKAYQG
ncbi:alpha-glucoside transport system substrate-binding protein [Actinacidiphila alni]|uniref:Alpha-glucoside transport system substrate-binding protein n=1 Tax=Actinacidiphila alni TaxID=380248 RepID=A0A1I2IYV1_9ACTN|nr:ABC transporter substrate-binding protein [Actinacidiphila alni]SFF47712.1 alpha-glucoside transport system substrate-binding protein [Actinacidiphila alni]